MSTQAMPCDVFVLAGQSNMAGRGLPVEEEDTTEHSRVFSFCESMNSWISAKEPLHNDKPSANGVGPGFAFARSIADYSNNMCVGLIPVAVGGSSISRWAAGADLFEDMLKCVRGALRSSPPPGVSYFRLRGVLWHQGESDCDPSVAKEYGPKLTCVINDTYKSLLAIARDAQDNGFAARVSEGQAGEGQAGDSRFYFLIGQLGDFLSPTLELFACADLVRNQIVSVAFSSQVLPVVLFVPSTGLRHIGDSLHFDAPAARELGKRYATTYLRAAHSHRLGHFGDD
eukprot:Rmarinus@m.8084